MSAALEPVEDLLALPVARLGPPMSVRLETLLRGERVENIGQLAKMTERELRRVPGLGSKSLQEIRELLERVGLALTEPDARNGTPPLPFPSVHARLTRIEQRLTALECQSGKPTTDDP